MRSLELLMALKLMTLGLRLFLVVRDPERGSDEEGRFTGRALLLLLGEDVRFTGFDPADLATVRRRRSDDRRFPDDVKGM